MEYKSKSEMRRIEHVEKCERDRGFKDVLRKEALLAKEKYEEAVCLVPRADSSSGITCHEYDFCKCDVDELLKEARKGFVNYETVPEGYVKVEDVLKIVRRQKLKANPTGAYDDVDRHNFLVGFILEQIKSLGGK